MPDEDAPTVRPFSAWLREQRSGSLHSELGERLAEAAAAVVDHEKAATLTLTIKLSPAGDGAVRVTDDVKTKIPAGDRGTSLFFTDDAGNLSRRNPRQAELPLRPVDHSEVA